MLKRIYIEQVRKQNYEFKKVVKLKFKLFQIIKKKGRAGRYGCQGIAVSLVTEKDEAAKFNEIIDTYDLRIQQFESILRYILFFGS